MDRQGLSFVISVVGLKWGGVEGVEGVKGIEVIIVTSLIN